MKLTRTFIIACCCITLLAACKKSDNKNDTSAKAQLLKAGKWQVSASIATFSYNGKDTTVDYYSQWRPCEQDDFHEYGDDGKGTSNENSNKCPEDNQVDPFTWEMQNDDTQVKVTLRDGRVIISDILELTDTQLKLKSNGTYSSMPAIMTETYKNIK